MKVMRTSLLLGIKLDKLEKPGLLNCPHQCIDTPKTQYCITILNENIDISIYRYVSHITRLEYLVETLVVKTKPLLVKENMYNDN